MREVPTSFEEYHQRTLDEEIEVLEKYVLNSSCKTFEEYRWCTGQLVGLKLARVKFSDMVEKLREQG